MRGVRHLRDNIILFIFLVVLGLLVSCAQEGSDVTDILKDKGIHEILPQTPQAWTGDLDGMVKRRYIRVLVPFSKTYYFIDKGEPRGLSYELLQEFEKYVNLKTKSKVLKVHVLIIPTPRDKLFKSLRDGWGDIAVGNLTITPERLSEVDFSDPFLTDVNELVVTHSSAGSLTGPDDLSGKDIYVRKSSSYYESLLRLNDEFAKRRMKKMNIILVDDILEDEDLLEMVNGGLIPMIVVDSHKAEFWANVFDGIKVHRNVPVNTGGRIAWAFRKSSPRLQGLINGFVQNHRKGTLMGNVLFQRYLRDTDHVKNSMSEKEIKKFNQTIDLFKKYADRYDFDYLLVAAQAYQESGLDHSMKSPAGAVGIMQVLPSTARDPNVNISEIQTIENNIHAGVKYLRFITDQYFSTGNLDRMNRTLLAFAAYNAGPAKVAKLREEAAKEGLDPDRWFGNVEVIAGKRIGRETVQYVSNIFKYYFAYRLVLDQKAARERARGSLSRR